VKVLIASPHDTRIRAVIIVSIVIIPMRSRAREHPLQDRQIQIVR